MARQYHCLIAGLPDLVFEDAKLSTTIHEFKMELMDNLHRNDYQLIQLLFLPVDQLNLIQYLYAESTDINPMGNYSIEDFEKQKRVMDSILEEKDILPVYMVDTMRYFYDEESEFPKLDCEKQLINGYYKYVAEIKNTFFNNWFEFELNALNLRTAQNCEKYQIPLEQEIIGTNELANVLRKSGVKDLSILNDFDYYDDIIKLADLDDYLDKEMKFDLVKWNYLEENTFFHYFSIEKIAGYLIKLLMVDRWMKLDKEKGEELFKKFISDLEKSHEFSSEFIVNR